MKQTKDVSYRKAYKSDHLGVVDLEEMIENGRPTVVTIKDVFFEEDVVVAGNKGAHNIAYFCESGIKPLVLNSTNAESVRALCKGGANLNTWVMPVRVELYIDATVKMKGQVVGGIRIKRQTPPPVKHPIKAADWPKALKAVESGQRTAEQLIQERALTDEQVKELQNLTTKTA